MHVRREERYEPNLAERRHVTARRHYGKKKVTGVTCLIINPAYGFWWRDKKVAPGDG